jgi:hypothetical protein
MSVNNPDPVDGSADDAEASVGLEVDYLAYADMFAPLRRPLGVAPPPPQSTTDEEGDPP